MRRFFLKQQTKCDTDKPEFETIELLNKSKVFPYNLGEGKLQGTQENNINYWLGCAYEGLNKYERTKTAREEAFLGLSEPSATWFYNDRRPDTIFYQGLALLKLNRKEKAYNHFNKLIEYGKKHISEEAKIDYFAV